MRSTYVMMIAVALAAAAGCGDNDTPDSMVDALPSCRSLGCNIDPTTIDKPCSATGHCTCTQSRGAEPIACAAPCGSLSCASVACDGDACACELDGDYVSCEGP